MTKWNVWRNIAIILWNNILSEEKQNAWEHITQFFAAQNTPSVKPEEVKDAFGLL